MKPLSFFVGRWDPKSCPIFDNAIFQVAVTKDKRWDESFEVVEMAAFEKLKADAEKLREALEISEKELFRFNCEAPLELTGIDKPVYLLAQAALEQWKAKYPKVDK